MQKTKKQLLGFVGLVAVGIMTAVAYAIPAAAVDNAPMSRDSGVNVNVYVGSGTNNARLTQPRNGVTVVEPEMTVAYTYEETVNVKTYLSYKDASGKIVKQEIDNFNPTEDYGTRSFTINLADYNSGDPDYKVSIVATGADGTPKEDTSAFTYRAISAEFENPSSNGDPVLKLRFNQSVQRMLINIYNNGVPLIADQDGNSKPLTLDRTNSGEIISSLPFKEYNAKDGRYAVVISAFDDKNNLISMFTREVDYYKGQSIPVTPSQPDKPTVPGSTTPDTPNTGFTIGDLNISRLDYLFTGLIVFGSVAGFALFLVRRQSRC